MSSCIEFFLHRISRKDVDARHKAGHDEFRAVRDRFDGSFASAQDTRNGTGFARLMRTGGN
jgi:hypothetical protein